MADGYSIEAELGADIGKFRRAIKKAKEVTQNFKKEADEAKDTEVDADTKPFQKKIIVARKVLDKFNKTESTATADANTAPFQAGIENAKRVGRNFADTVINKEVDANISPLKRNVKKARELMQSFTKSKKTVNVDADTANASRKLGNLQAKAQALDGDSVSINVRANIKKAMQGLNRLSNSTRTIRNMTKGGLMIVSPAAVPVIAAAAGAAGGLASSLTAAAGAAGVFGVAAIGHLTRISKKFENIKKINEDIAKERASAQPDMQKINNLISQREGIMKGMSKAQKQTYKTLNKLKDTWGTFLDNTETDVLKVFNSAMKVAMTLLRELEPVVKPAANAIQGLLDKMNAFAGTDSFNKIVDFFANRGANAIKNWGEIGGNILQGFMNLMMAFGGTAKSMEQWLIGITDKFVKWSSKVAESDGFKKFIQYVKTNGPKIMSLIGNIVQTIVNFGIAIAPLAAKVLSLVNSFFKWTAELIKNNQWIAKVVTVAVMLLGSLKLLKPVIKLVVGAFKLVKNAIKLVIPFFKKAWSAVKFLWGGFKKVLPWILKIGAKLKWLTGPVGIVIGIITTLATIVIKNWDKIWAWTKKTWNKVKNTMTTTWKALWKIVKRVASKIWNWVKDKFNAIKNTIQDAMNHASRIVHMVWFKIKQFFHNVISNIASTVRSKFQTIKNNISDKLNAAKNTITNIWNNIKSFFSNVIGDILSTVRSKFSEMINTVREKISGVRDAIERGLNKALDFVKGLGSSFLAAGKGLVEQMAKGVKQAGSRVINTVKNLAGRVRDYLPFSPAKTGPLSDLDHLDFGGPISDSLKRAIRPVRRASERLAASASITPTVRASQIKSSLRGLRRNSVATVESAVNADINISKDPAIINVRLGKSEFSAFVDDISNVQSRKAYRTRRKPQ